MFPSPNPGSRRIKGLLVVLALVIVLNLAFGATVQREFLAWLVVNSEVPAPTAVEELLRSYEDPVPFLSRLWKTGKVAHRQLALNGLKMREFKRMARDQRVETLLMAGAIDPDTSVRELALGALAEQQSSLLVDAAQAQLRNPDPQIRLLGVQHLARAEAGHGLPRPVQLLDDSDLRVVTTVEAALKRWTGIDFGVRIAHSIPKQQEDGQELFDPAELAAIRAGVERRKAWWAVHQREFRSDLLVEPATAVDITQPGSPAADFSLQDLSGRFVTLSSFRGKTVVLNFWTTWCMACLREIPDLVELQKRYTNQLVVLGISLDGVPDSHGQAVDHEESLAGLAVHQHEAENPSLESIRSKVARVVKARGIIYTVLLDPKSTVGGRFNGGDLPTNVLIDSTGHVRRRFVGARPLPVWEAMIGEIAPR